MSSRVSSWRAIWFRMPISNANRECVQSTQSHEHEGGAQDKEYRAKYAADRVRTVGMAWLGSTFACCECHDHKFDPISTRDFYSMSAFFADLEEQGFYDKGFDEGRWVRKSVLSQPSKRSN